MVTAALSPELILVAGDITSAWKHFAPTIKKELEESSLAGKPPRVLPTHEGEVARLRGAAALLLQRHSIRPFREPSLQQVFFKAALPFTDGGQLRMMMKASRKPEQE